MEYPYNGILINKTENGIALQYLKNTKALSLSVKLDNLEIKEGECYFIKNSDIDVLKVKNQSFLNKKINSIIIKSCNKKHCLVANVKEPLLRLFSI